MPQYLQLILHEHIIGPGSRRYPINLKLLALLTICMVRLLVCRFVCVRIGANAITEMRGRPNYGYSSQK